MCLYVRQTLHFTLLISSVILLNTQKLHNISIAHVLHRLDEFLKEKSQDQILTKWLQKALIHFSSMVEKNSDRICESQEKFMVSGVRAKCQPTNLCLWKGTSYCGNYWTQLVAFVLREKLYYPSIYIVYFVRHFQDNLLLEMLPHYGVCTTRWNINAQLM